MNVREHRFLLSQQATLRKLLSETDESEVIVRMSLNARLQEVEDHLRLYEGYSPRLIDARLTFDGKPVIEDDGIMAGFFAKALTAFEIAVASVGASRNGFLREMGPIPNRDAYGLLITGIARGSFGFEFNGGSQYTGSIEAESAVETVRDILEASLDTTDEYELAYVVGDIHQRALKHLCNFLDVVAQNEAVCTLRFGDYEVRFNDTEQVKQSAERLGRIEKVENIVENIELAGRFIGILPNGRRAEFLIESTQDVIPGPVSAPAVQSVQMNYERFVKVVARRRQIGNARPHYTFLRIIE